MDSGSLAGQSYPEARGTARAPQPPRYELHHEGPNRYVIKRVEVLGVFKSREDARRYMLDTSEQRKKALSRVR